MPLTHGSYVFVCSKEQAEFVAECANLEHLLGDKFDPIGETPMQQNYDYEFWEDHQTGGGGCRICWCRGIAWVSCHSGYSHADITREVADIFTELGCKEYDDFQHPANPHIYDMERFERTLQMYPKPEGD